MKSKGSNALTFAVKQRLSIFGLVFLSVALAACAGGPPPLPEPRPVVIRSGERLFAEPERMAVVDSVFKEQQENIEYDPGFMIVTVPRDTPAYPWESLYMSSDSATYGMQNGYGDANEVYQTYAHYRLMKKLGRIDEFIPGGSELEGFEFERAIVERVAEAWLLGRSVYQAVAYEPLEEILFANENGYLDAFLLTARGDEFEEEKEAWLEEDPEGLERYRQWFLETFDREPPGLREKG
jgi:hypothetical protein